MSIVLVMRNPNNHCTNCGEKLQGEPLKLEPGVAHWIAWCPEGTCKYAMRRMRVPLDLIQCEMADG